MTWSRLPGPANRCTALTATTIRTTLAAAASGASHRAHRRGLGAGPRANNGGRVSSRTLRPTAWPRLIPPRVEPGEHVLNDVFRGRPVPDKHHRQPDKFRVVATEERGDIHRWPAHGRLTRRWGPASAALTIAAFTAKRIAHTYGTHPRRVWLPGRFHPTHRAAQRQVGWIANLAREGIARCESH